jgi:hypothetical protein
MVCEQGIAVVVSALVGGEDRWPRARAFPIDSKEMRSEEPWTGRRFMGSFIREARVESGRTREAGIERQVMARKNEITRASRRTTCGFTQERAIRVEDREREHTRHERLALQAG